jgi:hypothetical protein
MQLFNIVGVAILIVLQILKYAVILRALLSFLPIGRIFSLLIYWYQITELFWLQ